jgi:DNA-binding NarL/FixJ family response regulator
VTEPIRVVLVDDQQLVRAGLAMVIDAQPDMTVVAQAGDGAEAVAVVAATPCDVVLMDVRMPGMDGLEATRRILAEANHEAEPDDEACTGPRIVMLTTYDLDEYLPWSRRRPRAGCWSTSRRRRPRPRRTRA